MIPKKRKRMSQKTAKIYKIYRAYPIIIELSIHDIEPSIKLDLVTENNIWLTIMGMNDTLGLMGYGIREIVSYPSKQCNPNPPQPVI